MKKSVIYIALLAIFVSFAGCTERQTPERDTTKLWPACDANGEKWGYIDAKGNFVIQPIYEDVTGFSCGYARVWMGTNEQPIFIDTKGKMKYSSADAASAFYYNYATAYMNGSYGLLNTSFNFTCQPVYAYLSVMSEDGLVAAKLSNKDTKYGYINAKGEWKINPLYDFADGFDGGVAVVGIGNRMGAIGTDGTYKIQPVYDELVSIGNGLIAFEQNDRVGVLDANGKTVVQPVFENLGYCFDNNLIPAVQYDKCGYINKKGDTEIGFMYEQASSFSEGYAVVAVNDREQIINTKGEVVLMLGEEERVISNFHNGLALIGTYSLKNQGLAFRYVNTKNEVVYSWSMAVSYNVSTMAKKAALKDYNKCIEMARDFDSRKLNVK